MNPLPFNLITPQSPGQERNRIGKKIADAVIRPFGTAIVLANPACRMCQGLLKRQDFRRTEGPAICIAQAERLGNRQGEQTQQEGPTACRSTCDRVAAVALASDDMQRGANHRASREPKGRQFA
ncbi:hypothetical protein EC9_48220 [Rosistilla ulvae]|uniref:Uncharacterized protein n=1 Tax=Rosistilla ulvae TaxID=1930277 RepID=A0A517M6V3_9BACT|nr:hypothetical protein EC9_48220 [Rosistilla ulvae]